MRGFDSVICNLPRGVVVKKTERTGGAGDAVAIEKSILRRIREEARRKYKWPKKPIVHVNIFNLPKEFTLETGSMSDFGEYLVGRVRTVVGQDIKVKVNICTKGMVSSSVLRQYQMAFDEGNRDYFKFTVEIVWACTENLIRYEGHNSEILRVIDWEISNRSPSGNNFVQVIHETHKLWEMLFPFIA